MKNNSFFKLQKMQKLFAVFVIFAVSLITITNQNISFAEQNINHVTNPPYNADVARETFNLLGIKKQHNNKNINSKYKYNNHLIVAISDLQDRPYYYVENNSLLGADVELMKEIAKKLNIDLKWRIMPFFKLEKELNNNNVDLAISMISDNEERRQKFLLSRPYAETNARFIFKDNKTYQNFLHKKYHLLFTYAVYGTSYDDYLIQNGFSIRTCANKMECQIAFINNEVNAGMEDSYVLKNFINQQKHNPNNKYAKNYVMSENIFKERLVIVTQKQNTKLMDYINKALKKLDEEGILKEISKKYFEKEDVYKYYEK